MAEEDKEKLEFLKREEVKTMAKDVAGLREKEAESERERITKLKTGEDELKKPAPIEVSAKKEVENETREEEKRERERLEIIRKEAEEREKLIKPKAIIPSLPARRWRSGWIGKVLIRVAVVLLLTFIISFAYWYFFVRETQQKQEEIILSPEEKLAALSLKERIGQLFIVGFEGKEATEELKNVFADLTPGGIILFSKNIESKEQVKTLIQGLQETSKNSVGLPLFVAVDQEGGAVNRVGFLEEKTSQAEIETKEQAFQVGLRRGGELKELGFNLNLAPVLDELNPGDFLYQRGFQKDVETSGELGKAIIEGQRAAGIFSALKHFPGYTGIDFNPEEKTARIPTTPVISQFQKTAEANPELIMAANVIVSEIDSQRRFFLSEKGINFLKESIRGDYLIMTDDLNQNVLMGFSLKDLAATPINSGVDIILFTDSERKPKEAVLALLEAVQNQDVSEKRINDSVLKIIKLKSGLK